MWYFSGVLPKDMSALNHRTEALWFGGVTLRAVCAFLLIGSLQGAVAGVIGNPTIEREITDTFAGYLYAYDGTFGVESNVSSWSFYAGSAFPSLQDVAGHQITPVIMDQSESGTWMITGIGETQTIFAMGYNSFSFNLVSGSASVTPNRTFGWYDGSSTSQNQGTISFDRATTAVGVRDFWYNGAPSVNKAYVTKNDFTGANDPNGWGGGRIYSVQFNLADDPVSNPEPYTLAMIAGGFAILAWLRRR
jgi:hypothetical protein